MEFLLIIVAIGGFLLAFTQITKQKQIKNETQRIEKQRRDKEHQEAVAKAQAEWENLLNNRIKEYGALTKQINFGNGRTDNVFVYEQAKTIFIFENKFAFSDIISCNIDKETIKGQTTYTTTPDKYQMAEEQVLWGMGQKYNVKTTTQTTTTPDKITYRIYIGVNNLINPQILLTLYSSAKANEINNLMNVIINLNNK